MNLKNRPPVFVPDCYQREIEELSKAALMDMVWDYAQQLVGMEGDEATMTELRTRREIILAHRKNAKLQEPSHA